MAQPPTPYQRRHTTRQLTPTSTPKGANSFASPLGASPAQNDAYLFEAPPELMCPITHSVFFDPCLTAAGHAYERKAVEEHLRSSDCDPLSRQPLPNKNLTPIFPLRSRALEYREAAARTCLERACSPSAEGDPARFLRRAVELVADTGFLPQGLTPDVVDYVQSHPSNVYDRLALQVLARSLHDNGYKERAAAVYFHLLSTDTDRAQQAAYLRRCLSCWAAAASPRITEAHPPGAPLPSPGRTSGSIMAVDDHAYDRLVALMGRRGSIAWVVEVAAEAGLGDDFVTRLCETLLFRPMPQGAGAEDAEPLSWDAEKALLLTYTHVLTGRLQQRQGDLERRVEELEGGSGAVLRRLRAARSSGGDSAPGRDVRGGIVLRRPAWLGHPLVVALLAAALAGTDSSHPASRVVRVLPVLALLPE